MTSLVTFGDASLRLTPTDGERFESTTDLRLGVSGTASNVAVAASQFGVDTLWLSRLPDSALGRRVVGSLHEHGVETDVAWTDEGRQGLLFTEQGIEPRADRRIGDQSGAAVAATEPGEIPMDRVQRADTVLLAGSTFALSEQAAATCGAVARAGLGGGTVALELDYRADRWPSGPARESLRGTFDAVDVLLGDEESVGAVFDRSGEPRELAHAVASTNDFETVVLRREDGGALAWHDSVIHEQSGVDGEVVDPAGGRGAFTGAVLAGLLADTGIGRALARGVAAAALVRTVPGATASFTPGEIAELAGDE